MSFVNESEIKVVNITEKWMHDFDVELFIKREDEIHPYVSGNKWRKLKYNLKEARKKSTKTILTFGGAFSNHLSATAAAAKLFGFNSIGIVRGEELDANSNDTLKFCAGQGMKLHFISRTEYRRKSEADFISELETQFGDFYLVPEGGSNALAVKGCMEILNTETNKFDHVVTAVGTGGTISGLISGAAKHQTILGVPVLKGAEFLQKEIEDLVFGKRCREWMLMHNYHFGGYGKFDDRLLEFIRTFKKNHGLQLDPIYTAKMMFAIHDLIKSDAIEKGSKILAIHTGGLQGVLGFEKMHNVEI